MEYSQDQYDDYNDDDNQHEQQQQQQDDTASKASQQSANSNLWKQFGRESDVGKMLFSMYSAKERPKVYYPPVKTKPRPIEQPKEQKPCPQKTQIEYPEMKPTYKKKTYHPIDFVPKRKGADEIQQEIQNEYNKPLIAPGKKGVNRKLLINDLQERFQFKDKAELDAYFAEQKRLKELALLPEVHNPQKKRRRKYNMGMAQKALQHYQEKYGKPPSDLLNMRPKTNEEVRNEQDEELEDLFDTVIEEIEERQEYLEKVIEMGGNKVVEKRIKNEIVERVAELQKIREIQNKLHQ